MGVLNFANDMVVMAESVQGLQSNLQVMSDVLQVGVEGELGKDKGDEGGEEEGEV